MFPIFVSKEQIMEPIQCQKYSYFSKLEWWCLWTKDNNAQYAKLGGQATLILKFAFISTKVDHKYYKERFLISNHIIPLLSYHFFFLNLLSSVWNNQSSMKFSLDWPENLPDLWKQKWKGRKLLFMLYINNKFILYI